ncbi:MAG TPA: EF-hand domain-containing protein [Thermomonas sp.]|jgi:Ca2+-binding EF-hand superfamily protein|uniref:EF-hand domain-containing protein n=1 Tax=Thermomonas sp. TaxID=1971895 RepID=UPI002CB34EA6|nr:EF-hand domain-containing protein [Thermomonas sp.]HOV96391.1 EF-hand domain-containing protein [Thermomonas sp.]
MSRILANCALMLAVSLAATGAYAQANKSAVPTTVIAPPAKDIAADTFREWDKNGDGQLSLAEFRAGWQQAQAAVQLQAQLRRQFASLDSNHNGAIDANEYTNLVLIKNAGKNAPPLARFDTNGDGKLEFGEYLKLVETLAPQATNKAGK